MSQTTAPDFLYTSLDFPDNPVKAVYMDTDREFVFVDFGGTNVRFPLSALQMVVNALTEALIQLQVRASSKTN